MMIQDSGNDLTAFPSNELDAASFVGESDLIFEPNLPKFSPSRKGIRKHLSKYVFVFASCTATFLLGLMLAYAWSMFETHTKAQGKIISNEIVEPLTEADTITVDVHGDVTRPGVYKLSADARVMDAVRAAGGYLHKEDNQFVNQAEPLVDGQEIIVSAPHESTLPESAGLGTQFKTNLQQNIPKPNIDLNTASESTFETIPGIGPQKAEAIIAYRNAHGPFGTVKDLEHIRGFGKLTLSKIEPYLFVQPND